MILAIAAGAVLVPFTAGAKVSLEGRRLTAASNLASNMVERILSEPFGDVISDYDGLVENPGQLKDSAGNVLAGEIYNGLRREVSCQAVYLSGQKGRIDADLICITVTVYCDGRELVSLNSLKGK